MGHRQSGPDGANLESMTRSLAQMVHLIVAALLITATACSAEDGGVLDAGTGRLLLPRGPPPGGRLDGRRPGGRRGRRPKAARPLPRRHAWVRSPGAGRRREGSSSRAPPTPPPRRPVTARRSVPDRQHHQVPHLRSDPGVGRGRGAVTGRHCRGWLPGLLKHGRRITVEQLLSHRSGLPDMWEFLDDDDPGACGSPKRRSACSRNGPSTSRLARSRSTTTATSSSSGSSRRRCQAVDGGADRGAGPGTRRHVEDRTSADLRPRRAGLRRRRRGRPPEQQPRVDGRWWRLHRRGPRPVLGGTARR